MPKLLLDANVSWRLVSRLQPVFGLCEHVDHTSLPVPATDIQIWAYAKEQSFIIVTNDEDFLNLQLLRGFPPKIVLLKTGNQRTEYLFDLLLRHRGDIEDLDRAADWGILELY